MLTKLPAQDLLLSVGVNMVMVSEDLGYAVMDEEDLSKKAVDLFTLSDVVGIVITQMKVDGYDPIIELPNHIGAIRVKNPLFQPPGD